MDKTRRLLEERLAPAGSARHAPRRASPTTRPRSPRRSRELQRRGNDLLIVFGASAMVDGKDVVPAGIEAAGGIVRHLGMPVDPGNLLVLGEIDGTPVLGAPGCARSPKENGFDWVLNRLLAGIDVTPDDITGARRRRAADGDRLAAAAARGPATARDRGACAAGSPRWSSPPASRGGWAGRTSSSPRSTASRWCASPPRRRCASRAVSVTVVTGSRADEVEAALAGLDVELVHNPDFAEGLSTSLEGRARRLPADVDGASCSSPTCRV